METTASRIYSSIKEQIINGHYAPGERLTEQSIAAEFSTSRTPVREAMRQLVADGFADFKPNSGTSVRRWTPEQMREIFELRVLLESEIASQAATRISAADIATLQQLQDQIESRGADVSSDNTARISPLNREFHRIIAQASQNTRLVAMLASAIEVPIVQQTFRTYSPTQLARSFSHHRELMDTFRQRDAAWARSVMTSHIHSAKHTVISTHNHEPD